MRSALSHGADPERVHLPSKCNLLGLTLAPQNSVSVSARAELEKTQEKTYEAIALRQG